MYLPRRQVTQRLITLADAIAAAEISDRLDGVLTPAQLTELDDDPRGRQYLVLFTN